MTLLTFLQICARIVEAWPEQVDGSVPLPYLRPDAFAFIDDEMELDSDSMGKDERYQYRPEFFSRHWKYMNYELDQLEKKYPAIFCWERVSSLDMKRDREGVSLQFCIQEAYIRKYDHDAEFDYLNRSKEQIADALRWVRDTFVKHLKEMTYSSEAGLDPGWYPSSWLTSQGFSASGQQLNQFLQFGPDTSTFSRVSDAGVIETYFEITLLTRLCAQVSSADFNYQDLAPM